MKRLVVKQLKKVTWKCSNTHMSRIVLGMNGLVPVQLYEGTWKC